MHDNPYRKEVELSPQWRWIGGMLFTATLAAPFAVIALTGGPTLDRETERLGPGLAEISKMDLSLPAGGDHATVATPAQPRRGVERAEELPDATAPAAPTGRSPTTAAVVALAVMPNMPQTESVGEAPRIPRPAIRSITPDEMEAAQAPATPSTLPDTEHTAERALPEELAAEAAAKAEEALDLTPADRRDVQIRLALMGHDPRGIDGIFGDQTREAIRAAQVELDVAETGFIDEMLLSRITVATEDKIAAYRRAERKRLNRTRIARNKTRALATRNRVPSAKDAPNCRRGADGSIALNQGISCDWNMLGESLTNLFREEGR